MAKRSEGTPEEELEDFARRMIDEIEDFDQIGTAQDWQDFIRGKFLDKTGRELTEGQLTALEFGRMPLMEFREQVGLHGETPFVTRPEVVRYRDTTGIFQKKGTWVSRAQAAARIGWFKP